MIHVKRIFAALLIAFLVVAQVSTIPDTAVMGGSNLITEGAIPYVSSSGTLNQNTTVQWDSANATWVHQTANEPSNTNNAFNLFSYRNSRALNILSSHTTALGALVVDSSAVTTGGGLWVGTGSSGFANTTDGLALFTSTHASSTGALAVFRHVGNGQGIVAANTSSAFNNSNGFARFSVTNASATGRVMTIANAGSGDSLYISPGSASTALYLDSTATNKDTMRILTTAQNNGDALRVTVYNAPTGTGKAFRINGGTTGSTDQMWVKSDGTTYMAGPVGIGPSNTSPSGTLHVYDATATTGVTTLTVRAGAGQSSTVSQQWLDSAGSTWFSILTNVFQNGGGTGAFANASQVLQLGSDRSIAWGSTASYGSSKDLGLARSSANNLGITNGSSTTYWTLGAGGILAGTDNSIDIGASGANRPRAIYVAGAGTFGGTLTAGGGASITGGNLSMNGNGISAVGALNYIANVSLPIGNVTHTTTISGGANVRIAPTYNTSGTGIAFTDFLINRTETSLGTTPGAQYLIDAQVGGTSKFSVTSAGAVTAASDFIGSSTSCIYLGATGTDGSWRFCRDSNDLVVSRRESGSWVAKGTWAP